MKKHLQWFLTACLIGIPALGSAGDLRSEGDKTSYSVGYQVGGDFQRQGVELNAEVMVQGVMDAASGAAPKLAPEEMRQILVVLKQKILFAQQEQQERQSNQNVVAGKKYMAENAKKEGVTVTSSGLQYEVLTAGEGDHPGPTDQVTVHYRGTLIDGTEFDSSYSRGKPAMLPLTRVIKGWTEGLQLMRPGAKYRFVIPPELAYGNRSTGKIQPSSTLIFEVELLEAGP